MTVIESLTAAYQLISMSWQVPSATEAGKVYTVSVQGNRYPCTCKTEEFNKTRGRCWHVKAVIAGAITSKPRVRIRPLEANVVAAAPAPAGNPSAWLYEA